MSKPLTPAAELAARLTEASPTQAEGFARYAARHMGDPLRHLHGSTDRRIGEVAAALGAHKLDALRLHAVWVGKVEAAEPGAIASFASFGRDLVESYVARVMAERAGLLEARAA